MATFVRGFVIPDVAEVHAEFQRCIRDAEALVAAEARSGVRASAAGGQKILVQLQEAYKAFNGRLRLTAIEAAKNAEKGMQERLRSTRVRAQAGGAYGLEELVVAVPLSVGSRLETGAVGIGEVESLDRAINRHTRGYGTYWRAQEYGTGQGGVPTQIGRVLLGSFTNASGGGATPPDKEYAGGGGGPHPVFLSRKNGATRGASGFGTIGAEIQGKHFIKFGADSARIKWRESIVKVQSQAIEELSGIGLGGA